MLTGNVSCAERTHMASTNKQYNAISVLEFHRKTQKKSRRESDSSKQTERAVKQMKPISQEIHFSKLCKEREEILTSRQTLMNK